MVGDIPFGNLKVDERAWHRLSVADEFHLSFCGAKVSFL
jgi:hypothetical protein